MNFVPSTTPLIEFGREICNDPSQAGSREWLVTNGIGGYASGTVGGWLTRRYHGLLLAALDPPVGRRMLVSKFDEIMLYQGRNFPLFSNYWSSGVLEPGGHENIESFSLEGTTPVWRFACGDARLEKRIWMQQGANTTFVNYTLRRALEPVNLTIRLLLDHRDHHGNTRVGTLDFHVNILDIGIKATAYPDGSQFYILSNRATWDGGGDWVTGFYLEREASRGLDPLDDHFHAGDFHVSLEPGEGVTFLVTTTFPLDINAETAYHSRQAYERNLIERSGCAGSPAWIRQLVLAADQFIVQREIPGYGEGRSVIAGYPWFGDWGRDTMISLPGLTLATGQPQTARQVLGTYARFVDQGMLPNRFPEFKGSPEFNTADATLWFFEALRAYITFTDDLQLLHELYPVLEEIISWHLRGTRFKIGVDPQDALLYAGEPGVQLTWMDAKVGNWVVTPRIGKPVEINALWYNSLRSMADFASLLGKPSAEFMELADRVHVGFDRFWLSNQAYLMDVLDGPHGNDLSMRPNQILAVSLHHSPLNLERQKLVVDRCSRSLYASFGLRSLAPGETEYTGRYGGDPRSRDGAYHQGTVWGWLIGPFIQAHLRVYQDPLAASAFLDPLRLHLGDHGLGTLSEIFDGDAPHHPHGCIAQAWTVAEVLRLWKLIDSHTLAESAVGSDGSTS